MAGALQVRGALTSLIKRGPPEDRFGIWDRFGRPVALFSNIT
jgi:hypothetical protein